MPNLPQRPFHRILIANRGEIALRILQSAHELSLHTTALYTQNDSTHVSLGRPATSLQIPGPESYTNIDFLIKLIKDNGGIDAVHPGYGFLSESSEFARRVYEETEGRCVVIGPGWRVLERTGNKLAAKELANNCGIPVLEAMGTATGRWEGVREFAARVGYPIMVKSVDEGGGRGIRLARHEVELKEKAEMCVAESASGKVFAEMAAVDGFRHVEVQIVGDGTGKQGVRHLWERDCSMQRRFQKIVEVAPCPVKSRGTVVKVIEAAVKMAEEINYFGLGTWEFLVNAERGLFYFLEINPRLQVEHTITEGISGIDLVQTQLLLAQGASLEAVGLKEIQDPWQPPRCRSIQLRLCAEDSSTFTPSIGKIKTFHLPSGNGIRVDTHLAGPSLGMIGSDFDNLIAKIIVTASTRESMLQKARRALQDTEISGVKTNLNLLRAIVADSSFQEGNADTSWLEQNVTRLNKQGQQISHAVNTKNQNLSMVSGSISDSSTTIATSSTTSTLFRKGDTWSINLIRLNPQGKEEEEQKHSIHLNRLLRNEFPTSLTAEISHTITSPNSANTKTTTTPYKLTMQSTTNTAAIAVSSTHRLGDMNNPSHIVVPMSGKLVEVLVQEGDEINEGQVLAYLKQMKMELEVRSPRRGRVRWTLEVVEEGEDVVEGVLLVELEAEEERRDGGAEDRIKGKL